MMVHVRRFFHRIGRFFARELSAPFEDLPTAYGDPRPPELRVFEAEMAEQQHQPVAKSPVPQAQREHTKPDRLDWRPPND
jgi:hypothetical protein